MAKSFVPENADDIPSNFAPASKFACMRILSFSEYLMLNVSEFIFCGKKYITKAEIIRKIFFFCINETLLFYNILNIVGIIS